MRNDERITTVIEEKKKKKLEEVNIYEIDCRRHRENQL
jgi:hypothetical protein